VTVKHSNSANGDSRGIFIEDGLVVFVTKYHKNVGQTGKGKVIHRYVPREVGELVVLYLWFAYPFWRQIEGAVQGKAVDVSAYVWEPEPEQKWQQPERKRKRASQGSPNQDRGSRARRRAHRAGVGDEERGSAEESEACQRQGSVELWNSN
jgi:hypothetical protein